MTEDREGRSALLRGLDISASGMIAEMARVDVISNNMANVATPGFKRAGTNQGVFYLELVRARSQQEGGAVRPDSPHRIGARTQLAGTWVVQEQGALRFTDNSLHAAINGPGYFVAATPSGERYTRDGRFHVDQDGWLVTAQGHRVLGEQGPIRLSGTDAAIGAAGAVTSNGELIGVLRIVDFAQPGALQRVGDNLFAVGAAGEPQAVAAVLSPRHIEESNVNAVAEMVELIAATRRYEANQKVIQAHDDTLSKAVNEVGRV
jgi:flagellar basal-body rod protein FlgF